MVKQTHELAQLKKHQVSLLGFMFFVLVFFSVGVGNTVRASSQSNDKKLEQTKAYPITSYLQEESQARGYTSLVLNYPFVRQEMIRGIGQGKAHVWKTWLSKGVQKNYSLYWWMLSQWYESTGNKKQAYMTAVQAMVYSKVELKSCVASDKEIENVHNNFMLMHRSIVSYKPTQDEIRMAVLSAVGRVESQLNQDEALSGQACFRLYALQGYIPEDLSDSWQRRGTGSQAVVQRQQRELEKVKAELSYKKIVQTSTIEQIWSSDRKNQKAVSGKSG